MSDGGVGRWKGGNQEWRYLHVSKVKDEDRLQDTDLEMEKGH